jgi:UDP-glucose 4-epimerase
MKVLLTGAFGNVGESVLLALFNRGYEITCFDLHTDISKKTYKRLTKVGNFDVVWGDITDKSSVEQAMQDANCIIHLAAIIPPLSEKSQRSISTQIGLILRNRSDFFSSKLGHTMITSVR